MNLLKPAGAALLVFALQTHAGPNAGPALFSATGETVAMPQAWRDAPVDYAEKDRGFDLVISLGQQTYPALHKVIGKFAEKSNLKIKVHQGSCGISAGRLVRKKVDIGAFCCPPGKTDRLPGLRFHTVGIAPIALVTNKANPIDNVSLAQARDIFRGKHRHWDELLSGREFGGKRVSPVGRLHCKARPGHWHALLGGEREFSPSLFEVGVIPDMLAQIQDKADAIGYETAYMIKHYKADKAKTISIDGMDPMNLDNLRTGKYPMYRAYSLTTWDNNKPELSRKLIDFVTGYIEEHHGKFGFIPKSRLVAAGWQFTGEELTGAPAAGH